MLKQNDYNQADIRFLREIIGNNILDVDALKKEILEEVKGEISGNITLSEQYKQELINEFSMNELLSKQLCIASHMAINNGYIPKEHDQIGVVSNLETLSTSNITVPANSRKIVYAVCHKNPIYPSIVSALEKTYLVDYIDEMNHSPIVPILKTVNPNNPQTGGHTTIRENSIYYKWIYVQNFSNNDVEVNMNNFRFFYVKENIKYDY